jgi:predicted small secreted protein
LLGTWQEGAVNTKWLLRQLVSHGALTYGLLGFLGGLLWLSLTARAPALVAPGLGDGPRPVSVSASSRATLQDAIDSVRRFTGQPSLVLEGGIQTAAETSQRGALYYLETVSPTRGEDFFKVDARTGEVVEATMRGRLAPGGPAADLAQPAAEALATQFARANFWGFDQLTLVDRSMRTGESGTVYSFKWTLLAAESRAELPTSVSLAVAGRSGQVFWYLSQREPVQIETRPTIQQAQAIEIARAWLGPRDERWNLAEPAAVRLQILYDDDDQQQLVWSVQFPARQTGPRSSVRLLIDAQTGTLIQSGA